MLCVVVVDDDDDLDVDADADVDGGIVFSRFQGGQKENGFIVLVLGGVGGSIDP